MTTPEFQPWPKIARLNRNIVITEKIDGTNAAIGVRMCADNVLCSGSASDCTPVVYAQSRTRIITPKDDNFGFARWVADHAAALAEALGEGLHFGEWWGAGIQRGYGLVNTDRRFSLFNTARWGGDAALGLLGIDGDAVRPVPVLYEGPFEVAWGEVSPIQKAVESLRMTGSVAAPGFMNPEGIVVYMTASRTMHKVTLVGDEAPKGVAA